MTDAARQRYPEGRAPESRADLTSASQTTLRCSRTLGAGLLHLAAPSLPLPRTSSATESAGSTRRIETGIYGETSTQPDSAGPSVRNTETVVHQRGGQQGVALAVAARARAWVSRNKSGNTASSWNISLTVCSRTSWRRCIRCSCLIDISQSTLNRRNQQRQRQGRN